MVTLKSKEIKIINHYFNFLVIFSSFSYLPSLVRLGEVGLSSILVASSLIFWILYTLYNHEKFSYNLLFYFSVYMAIITLSHELSYKSFLNSMTWLTIPFLISFFKNFKIQFVPNLTFNLALTISLCILFYNYYNGLRDASTSVFIATIFPYFLMISYSNKFKFIVIILIFFLIIEAGTRIGLISILFSFVYYYIYLNKSKYGKLAFLIIPIVIIIGMQSTNLNNSTFEGDNAIAVGDFAINSSGRVNAWESMIDSIADSPIFGHGTSMPSTIDDDGWGHPHNDYLRLLHQGGVVGLVLFLIPLIKFYIYNKYSRINILSFLIIMTTDNPIVYPFSIFLFFILITNKSYEKTKYNY